MLRTPHDWNSPKKLKNLAFANFAKAFRGLKNISYIIIVILICSASNIFAEETETKADSSEKILQNFEETPQADFDSLKVLNLLKEKLAETLQQDSLKTTANTSTSNIKKLSKDSVALKTVLYLGGGERSPWFHLGVLYAIEEYKIKIDSIVAVSWGAWIGALWAKGVPLDNIQKMMLDSAIAPFIGFDLNSEKNTLGILDKDDYEWPISLEGTPSIRQRFILEKDSAKFFKPKKVALKADSTQITRALAKLRFQESLYRINADYKIPLQVLSCKDANVFVAGNSVENIIESLPLWGNEKGEICPYYALPLEDNFLENSIIVVADPLRGQLKGSTKENFIKQKLAEALPHQPGILVRAHTILDTARSTWIQAGFSSFEKHLSTVKSWNNENVDYSKNKEVILPWFRFNYALDSMSAKMHNVAKSYWNENDTGMVAPKNFATELLKNPAYDSIDFKMQESGHLLLHATSHPTFDFALGGFGSNALGPMAYAEGSMYYVNKMELQLSLAGFYGENSYGILPKLTLSRLWNRHFSMRLGFDYLKLSPLKSYNNNFRKYTQIETEERKDFKVALLYDLDIKQQIALDFLLGRRNFLLNPKYYGTDTIKTYPVSPMISYHYLDGDSSNWFSKKNAAFNISAGFESIGFDAEIIDVIPIYWKILADARYSFSPVKFATFAAAAEYGIERYHDEGHGYVSPKSFDIAPLDLAYRQHVKATPWSSEWYNPELSSHEYGSIRLSGGLHKMYFGAWVFAAFFKDFEKSELAELNSNKFILEPALRFTYRSIEIYAGLNKIVDNENLADLKKLKHYNYFIKVGNYEF